MALSGDEQDQWRHIETELASERRLTRLSKRMATVAVGVGLPVKTSVFWLLGGLTGLIALIAGIVTQTRGLVMAGMGVLIVTVLVAGVLLIAIGITSPHGRHRPTNGRA